MAIAKKTTAAAKTRKPAAKRTTTRKTAPRKKVVLGPVADATDTLLDNTQPTETHARPEFLKGEVNTPLNPAPVSHEEKQAKLEAYYTLKQAGVTPPAELAAEVETWILAERARQAETAKYQEAAAESQQRQVENANVNGPWYVRNAMNTEYNIRLERQHDKAQRRIMLKPRGTPGDLHPLKDEDLDDPILRQNVGLGYCEIIPAGEAQQVILKQTTNMSQRVHAPLAVLRNENNQPYAQGAVRVETEYNSQGITVATVDPRIMQGQIPDREIGGTRATGGLTRVQPGQPAQQALQPQQPQQAQSVVHSGFVPTGGNPAIVSQGAQGRIQQDIANRKTREANYYPDPGEITVTVDPVVRT
jgi:hypothetical protein